MLSGESTSSHFAPNEPQNDNKSEVLYLPEQFSMAGHQLRVLLL